MSAHNLSKLEADIRWHLRSTCREAKKAWVRAVRSGSIAQGCGTHLPRDRRVARADGVVARRASGRASVLSHVCPVIAIDDHATHEIRVVVRLIVDNREDLGLDADLSEGVEWREGDDAVPAEDTVIEWGLILARRPASASAGVRPMNLVGLADVHAGAVLPRILQGDSTCASNSCVDEPAASIPHKRSPERMLLGGFYIPQW